MAMSQCSMNLKNGKFEMWNSKVKCRKVYRNIDNRGFVVGNTYKVINGKLILPNGEESYGTYDCIEKLNEAFYAWFEEVE